MKYLKYIVPLLLIPIILAGGYFLRKKLIQPAPQEIINLWKNGPPSENNLEGEEVEMGPYWVTNISKAQLYLYRANNEKDGKVVIICSAGAYEGLSIMFEGTEWAKWLQSRGITAVVLKYRMPNGNPDIPIDDLKEAIRYVRNHADDLKIDPNKVGFMGISAGGHLTSYVATLEDSSVRPNFLALFYPLITMGEYTDPKSLSFFLKENNTAENIYKYSVENHVRKDTPPTLIFHCDDDIIALPVNAKMYYDSLIVKGVDATLITYPEGGHGWGTRADFKYTKEMTESFANWLDNLYK